MSAPDHDVLRVLVLDELMRAKHRTRWRDPASEAGEDLIIGNCINDLLADPDASLSGASEILLRILRAQIAGSKPRG
jgi:hypothetical protein